MGRVADIYLGIWCLYITLMTIGSWFGPDINSFEDWLMSIVVWIAAIVIGFAIRGNN